VTRQPFSWPLFHTQQRAEEWKSRLHLNGTACATSLQNCSTDSTRLLKNCTVTAKPRFQKTAWQTLSLFPRTKKCWLGQQSQVGQEYGGTSFYFLKLKGIKCLLKDKIKRAKKDMESTRTSAGTSDQSTLIAITAAGSSLFLHIPSGQICLLLDLSASYWIKPPFALRYLSDFPQNCFHVLPKITT